MSNTLAVQQLRTEFAERPMAVEVRQPRFSWQLHSTRRDSRQVVYRVVAHCHEAPQRRLLWDSAWVESSASLEIPYQGEALNSRIEPTALRRIRVGSGSYHFHKTRLT